MSIWNISNPSDPVTLKSDDHLLVALATCILGRGKYAAEEIGGERKVPFFLFGGSDDWFKDTFNQSFEEAFTAADQEKLADVLDTAALGSPSQREGYDKILDRLDTPEERNQWRAEYHDKERTSLNNICSYAWAYAEAIRQQVLDTGQ